MKKIALVVGHNLRSQGAYSKFLGKTEYTYCKEVCERIKELTGVDVYERKPNKFYTWEMDKVLSKINEKGYDYILEMHFNAAIDRNAHGAECLVYWKNKKAQEVASCFLSMLQNKFRSKIRRKWSDITLKKVVEVEKKINGKKEKVRKKVEVKEVWEREGLLLIQNRHTRGGYGICNSKGSYILTEAFFGTNPESLQFKDVEKVAVIYAEFIEKLRKGAL